MTCGDVRLGIEGGTMFQSLIKRVKELQGEVERHTQPALASIPEERRERTELDRRLRLMKIELDVISRSRGR